jgi:hypothetical protein
MLLGPLRQSLWWQPPDSWAACQLHHVDISTDASTYPVTIAAAGDQAQILDQMKCAVCEPSDAVAYLDLRPGKHVFRGVVTARATAGEPRDEKLSRVPSCRPITTRRWRSGRPR